MMWNSQNIVDRLFYLGLLPYTTHTHARTYTRHCPSTLCIFSNGDKFKWWFAGSYIVLSLVMSYNFVWCLLNAHCYFVHNKCKRDFMLFCNRQRSTVENNHLRKNIYQSITFRFVCLLDAPHEKMKIHWCGGGELANDIICVIIVRWMKIALVKTL